MIIQASRYAPPQQPPRAAAPAFGGALAYLPDALVAMIVVFMSMRLFGVGPLTALIWMGCAGLLLLSKPVSAGVALFRWLPLLGLPLLAFLSFIWSDLSEVSARYGFQLLLTAYLGVFISRVLPPHRFATALFLGMLIFCIASILSGRQGMSADGMVLVGLTGSKNAMAFAGNTLLTASLAVVFLPSTTRPMRLLAILGVLVSAYIVSVTASATAVLLSFATVGVFVAMCVLQNLPTSARISLIIGAIVFAIPILFLQNEINDLIVAFMRDVLHKDPTLTGRTYLWDRADDLIARRPLLGYGYQAIWLGETSDTLGLLRWAGQTDGRVFNFHHTYRQIAVDTGLIGMGVFILTIILVLFAGIKQFIVAPTIATSFALAFFVLTLTKSFTEVIIGAFNAQTLILFACATYIIAGSNKIAQRAAMGDAFERPRTARAPRL